MRIHINTHQNQQLKAISDVTGIAMSTLLEEAFCLFLERFEYVLRQDPYVSAVETMHYEGLESQGCFLEIDLKQSPGNAISYFLLENLALNAVSLSYVARKSLALLFEGKNYGKQAKKLHI